MATLYWLGNALATTQVSTLTPANVEVGDVFTVTINGKSISVTATEATVANVVELLTAAWNASTEPEFLEAVASDDTTHVTLTAVTAGKPFTVTTSTSQAGFTITVTTLQNGGTGTNEVKTVQLAGVPTGGTFTLTFGGQTTSAQAYNESAANLEADLEALSSIGVGNVAVTRGGSGISGDPYIWTVTFQGTLASTNVGAITGNGSSLTGAGEITHVTIQEGGATSNEVQTITQPTTDSGMYRLQDDVGVLDGFSSGMTAAAMQAAFEYYFGVGSIFVSRETSGGNYVYTLRFAGAYGGIDRSELYTYDFTGDVNNTHATVTEGGGAPVNEIQRYTILNGPTGGTYTLTYDGATTSPIAYNASAATVVTELEAIAGIGVGDVAVTKFGSGTVANPYIYEVEFQGALAGVDVSQLTSTPTSLTGAEVLVVTITEGAAGTNEIQQVEITGGTPTGGTFTLAQDYGAGTETSAGIAYNATAAQLRAALEALATPVPGDLVVTGAAGGPYTIKFQGAFDSTDFAEFVGNGASLTGTGTQTLTAATTTACTGPNFADDTDNWSGGALPVNGDTVFFQNTDVPMLYNLNALSGVTLTALYIDQSFTGRIGLPHRTGPAGDGYVEYRPTYWAIGATAITIGRGEGSGPPLVKINVGSVQTTLLQENSGGSLDSTLPAIIFKGTHASNAVTVNRGSFGAAVFAGETATIATLNQGYVTDPAGDSQVVLGLGCTLTTITKSGGTLDVNSAVTTLTQDEGETSILAGAVTTLTIRGGTVFYNGTGTLTTASVAGSGTLDFSQDLRAKTVSNPIDLYDQGKVVDPNKVVSSLILDYNGFGKLTTLDIGNNIRVTRGAVA